MDDLRRPFEILRLIRDGEVTNLADLKIRRSEFRHYIHDFLEDLNKEGFIEIDASGNLTPTPSLSKTLRSLRISLGQLASCDEESIVCSSAFGAASEPPFDVDVFVLMPFLIELKPVYDDHIRNVVKGLHLRPARADDFFTAGSIIDDIWNAINASRLLIADCTGRNPNVFYELGIAHTLGKPVILISQRVSDIPFDVQHIRAIIYEYTPRGMKEFEERLRTTLKAESRRPLTLAEYVAGAKSARLTSPRG